MYFPYLRGRQNELLALRELICNDLLGQHVIPIIEPVKLSATLVKTIAEFVKKEHSISIIMNPSVGSFSNDMKDTEKDSYKANFLSLIENDLIIKAHIMKENSAKQLKYFEDQGIKKSEWLIINNNRDYLSIYEKEFETIYPKYVLIPDESVFRRRVKRHRVLLDDKFVKQSRNVDYINTSDESFSDDHLYYKDDGFEGFADYSVIGNEYQESGFLPYAVVIHIVYFASDKSLRIRHFVSDSNDDNSNPAKKFYEAVQKLAKWYKKESVELTLGLQTFLEHYNQKTYPGLGSIKKLSIMHHLELMGKYLDEVD
ncbi:MAG: sce7725 family protein [Bacillota bacterium]